ncbi:hypothetical protein [Paraburkholderia domus]|nr:hypothetical protein [Paraburkholderia domus]MBK5118939.1 hypothetical protein [Burkholderia sp. R-69980]MBK5168102.1 hypothetical protein [Burkholderia sp. R-70211]MBK5183332.1 hypothetical protein [Burkholderia sp. R-69749]MCI0152369.1 hypothetical protein [Paraburkholderia sediminicola]
MASSDQGPLSAAKPTFKRPRNGPNERPLLAAHCLSPIGGTRLRWM